MLELSGHFFHQIDEKGRIRIPAHIKELLGPNPMIVLGTHCLYMYERNEGKRVIEEYFMDKDSEDEEYKRYSRIISATALFPTEDKQGRIQLTVPLIKHAKLNKDIVTVGAFSRAEIWSLESWQAYIEGASVDFDACLVSAKKKRQREQGL